MRFFFHLANDLTKVTEQLLHELKDNLRNEDKGEIVDRFQQFFNTNALLVGCASCGIREFVMGKTTYHYIPVEQLSILLLTNEQIASYTSVPDQYKPVISVYKFERTGMILLESLSPNT
jgi:hypothetical protein